MTYTLAEIQLELYNEDPLTVPAVVFGQVAVHLLIPTASHYLDPNKPRYVITHIASGMNITPFLQRSHLEIIPTMEQVFTLAERCAAIDFDAFWMKHGDSGAPAPEKYIKIAETWDEEFNLQLW